MNNINDKTTSQDFQEKKFSSIETDKDRDDQTSIEAKELIDDSKEPKGSGWGVFPKHFLKAIKDDFSVSIFVITFIGYILIEIFRDEGINLKEYFFVMLLLLCIAGITKVFSNKILIKRIIDVFNSKKVFAIIILLLIIDIVLNHWSFVVFIFNEIIGIF